MQAHGKTWMARKEDSYDRDWYAVDADGHIVGRLATQIAMILMGKHKPGYTPHVDTGDCVVVTNVERVRFTGRPMQHSKVAYVSSKLKLRLSDSRVGWLLVASSFGRANDGAGGEMLWGNCEPGTGRWPEHPYQAQAMLPASK